MKYAGGSLMDLHEHTSTYSHQLQIEV